MGDLAEFGKKGNTDYDFPRKINIVFIIMETD